MLTGDLFEVTHDKHLAVTLSRQPSTTPASNPTSADPTRALAGARENFGVQRVEVLGGNVGYLKLTAFYRLQEMRETLAAAMLTLQHTDALILDLRENTGGSPESVALLLSYLFDKPSMPLFEIINRGGEHRRYATEDSPLPGRNGTRPVYVLTAARTFSAGEGIAFILQEYGRAEIIGEQTAGAANPGRPYPVNNRFEVTVPNGRVRTAVSGRNWEGNGVTPDVPVAAADSLRTAHARALRDLLTSLPSGPWRDTLQRHLDTLTP
jgi:C-terminal processing protease CtpA/Prc